VALTGHAVVIAGGGPTGLMLAGELALAKVDVAIVERRANQDVPGRRAGGLHARTIEVLDQRGIADRFLSQGKVMQVAGFAMVPLDISDFPTRHNYGLALRQEHIERILADWVSELKVPIHRAFDVTGFTQDDTGVDVELGGGGSLGKRDTRLIATRIYVVGGYIADEREQVVSHVLFSSLLPAQRSFDTALGTSEYVEFPARIEAGLV